MRDAPAQLVSSGVLGLSRGVLGKCEGQKKRDRLCWGKHSPEPSFSSGSRHQAFTGGLSFLSSSFFISIFFFLLKCLVRALEGRRLFKDYLNLTCPLWSFACCQPRKRCGCFSTFAHCSICQELRIPPFTEPTPGPPWMEDEEAAHTTPRIPPLSSSLLGSPRDAGREGRNFGQDARSGKDPQRGFGLAAPFRQ